jgi:uncharacterized membrane protein
MTATGTKTNRIPALGFMKGALVLIMFLYHFCSTFPLAEMGQGSSSIARREIR